MNRRSSLRLSLKRLKTEEFDTNTDPVLVERKSRRLSCSNHKKLIIPTEQSEVKAQSEVESESIGRKHRRTSVRSGLRNSFIATEESDIDTRLVERTKRRSSISSDLKNLIINTVDAKPLDAKNRRTSFRSGVKSSTVSIEESHIGIVLEDRRKRRLSITSGLEKSTTEELVVEQVPADRKKRRLSHCTEILSSEENIEPVYKSHSKVPRRNSVKNTLDCNDLTQIKKYYLDKTVQNKPTSLETIFEVDANSDKLMGRKKFKRFIPFKEINRRHSKKHDECLKKLSARKIKSIDEALRDLQDIVD